MNSTCSSIKSIGNAEACIKGIVTVFGEKNLRLYRPLGTYNVNLDDNTNNTLIRTESHGTPGLENVAGLILNRPQNKIVGMVNHNNEINQLRRPIDVPNAPPMLRNIPNALVLGQRHN